MHERDCEAAPLSPRAINYVLHCMTGALPEKGIAFANLKAPAQPRRGTVWFHGAAGGCALRSASLAVHNARKVFCNLQDSLAGLTSALNQSFSPVQIEVIGYRWFGCRNTCYLAQPSVEWDPPSKPLGEKRSLNVADRGRI